MPDNSCSRIAGHCCATVPPSGRCPDRRYQPRPCWPAPVSMPAACSLLPVLLEQPWPCVLRFMTRARGFVADWSDRLHPALLQTAPPTRTSDAVPSASSCRRTLLLVRPFVAPGDLLRPLLTSRSGSTPSPFQAQGEISPGKNALLHCTTAGSTPLPLGHESFAVLCPLALVGTAFYPVLVHRPAASLHASSPHSVALMQLRFASLAVTSLRRDLHPQECAHAGRTNSRGTA